MTDNTEKSSETCLGREEITQIIRQELQSQRFSGKSKEANKICYYCGKNGHILRFCRKRQYDLGGAQQYAYGQYLNQIRSPLIGIKERSRKPINL